MRNTTPGVTVIVPAYNAQDTIRETLISIARQTRRDFEAIIVNDGSTDRTRSIVKRFIDRDGRFRVIDKDNSGVADARNTAISAARAPLIAPIDADDVWHPEFLERMSNAIVAAGPNATFAYTNFRKIDTETYVIGTPPAFEISGAVVHQIVVKNIVGNGSGIMFRKTHANAIGGYERRLQHEYQAHGCEDWLFQARLAQRGPVVAVPDYLVGYRFRPAAMSSDKVRMQLSRIYSLDIFAETKGDFDERILCWSRVYALTRLAFRLAGRHSYRRATLACVRSVRLSPTAAAVAIGEKLSKMLGRLFATVRGMVIVRPHSRSAKMTQRTTTHHFFDLSPSQLRQPFAVDRRHVLLKMAARADRRWVRQSNPTLGVQSPGAS